MKKITLAIALLTLGAQAQNFPSPYCDMAAGTTVEEITTVNFAETTITNADATSVLLDKTSTTVNVAPNGTYTITVEGNTAGAFDNNIVAFIDWNQNDVLDDDNEVYPIGTISNSTGSDGASVTFDITVPADAILGSTRIRVTKTYTDDDSIAEVNPCAIEMNIGGYGIFPGFGQALDFTLDIATLGTNSFQTNALSVYPVPTQSVLNIAYTSEINAVKIYNLLGQEVYAENTATARLQLDVSLLSAGAYIVKLVTARGQHQFRMLKQ